MNFAIIEMSILGPSGAGKTTILKAVAGLIEPVRGDIRLDGKSLAGVPPDKRNTIMVFQKPLLFPFMNVEQNIAFGLRMKGMTLTASATFLATTTPSVGTASSNQESLILATAASTAVVGAASSATTTTTTGTTSPARYL